MSTSLKITAVLIVIAAAVNIFLLSNNNIKRSDLAGDSNTSQVTAKPAAPCNVATVEDKQVITLTAKGGYSPKVTTAKADVPTVIKMVTKGTFDCSTSVSIPSLKYQTNLSPTGETLIDVPAQPKGSTLQGTCSMGMYNFSIKFE